MIKIKNKRAIERMRVAGEKLAFVMHDVGHVVEIGRSTSEIDEFIEKRMRSCGLVPECKGYAGYPAASCISLNDTLVHGIPSEEIILKNGDFVKIDVVGSYKGYCVDMARGFFVGDVGPVVRQIAEVVQRALDCAVDVALPGNRVSDISHVIQREIEAEGFSVAREYAGHGIGKELHEVPEVPNFGERGTGPVLRAGMTLALEPMLTERPCAVLISCDGWGAKTSDGCMTGHVEDTVLVGEDGPEVLTRLYSRG